MGKGPDRKADRAAEATDDAALFRQAVGAVRPIHDGGRARLEAPKPAPLPRPRAPEPKPAAAPPARHAPFDPTDPGAQFRAAVGAVTPVHDGGRVQLSHPPRAAWRQHPTPAPASGKTSAADSVPPPLPPLPATDDPHELFLRAVGQVAPLKDRNRAVVARPLPPPTPRQTEADEEAVLHEAISAPLSVEDRLDMGDETAFLRAGIARRVLADLRRGRWVVQGELDLHGLTREQARDALGGFLAESLQLGRRCLRLIHGKGLGSPGQEPVLKHLSRTWLARREDILAFCQARPQDGGEGALLILLRAPRSDRTPATGQDDRPDHH